MSDEASKPDPICAALRDRLAELNIQRDQAEMEISRIDARINEIQGMIELCSPKRGRGRPKGGGMRIAVVPETTPAAGRDDVFPPEDAA